MAGARIEVTEDTATPALAEAAKGLSGDARRLMLEDIGEYLTRTTRERAAREISPDGQPWLPLSPAYKRWKDQKRPGVPMLKFDFHMLGDMLSHQVVGNELLVGTNAPYGAAHQFGATIKHEARKQDIYRRVDRDGNMEAGFVKRRRSNFAQSVDVAEHTTEVPARPWLGISAEDEQEIGQIGADHLNNLFGLRG